MKSLRLLLIVSLLFWSLAPAMATAAIEEDANTVALWHFDEGTGTTSKDVSGNNNDLVLGSGDSQPLWVSGLQGSALQFDGSDLVTFGTTNVPILYEPVAVDFWFMLTAEPSSEQSLWAYGADPTLWQGGSLGLVVGPDIIRVWRAALQEDPPISIDWSEYINKWVHIALVLDGAQNQLYFNGAPLGAPGGIPRVCDFSLASSIGSRGLLYGVYLDNGVIDDMRISNIARTPGEILTTYEKNAPRGAISGTVWHDVNADGKNVGEAGLAGWTVTLYGEDGITVLESQATDASGAYKFENLKPGTYYVAETLGGPEWSNTTPLKVLAKVEYYGGEIVSPIVDFGNEKPLLGFHADTNLLPYTGGLYHPTLPFVSGPDNMQTSNPLRQISNGLLGALAVVTLALAAVMMGSAGVRKVYL